MLKTIQKQLGRSQVWFAICLIVAWGVQWGLVEKIAQNNAKIQNQIELMPQIDAYTKSVIFYMQTIRKYLNLPDPETKADIYHLGGELFRQASPHRYFGPDTPEEDFLVANYFQFDELVRSRFTDFDESIEAGVPLDEAELKEFYKRMDDWENLTPIKFKETQIKVISHFLDSNTSMTWWIRGLNVFMAAFTFGFFLTRRSSSPDPEQVHEEVASASN